MPRSTPKRKSSNNKTQMNPKPVRQVSYVVENVPLSTERQEKYKQAQMAINSLVKLGAQEGTIKDWMFVHYRIIQGLYVLQHYFERNDEAEQVLAAGLDTLASMLIRVHVKGFFAIFIEELDNVTEALNFASEVIDSISLIEMKHAHYEVAKYYDRTIAKNMESYPAEELERIKMVKLLEEEKKQVQSKQLKAA